MRLGWLCGRRWVGERYARSGDIDKEGRAIRALAMIPDKEMRDFADTVIGSAPLFDPSNGFVPGETVRVIDGSFRSFNGVIEDINDKTGMLKVAVSIFGRATPVELEPEQVERTLTLSGRREI